MKVKNENSDQVKHIDHKVRLKNNGQSQHQSHQATKPEVIQSDKKKSAEKEVKTIISIQKSQLAGRFTFRKLDEVHRLNTEQHRLILSLQLSDEQEHRLNMLGARSRCAHLLTPFPNEQKHMEYSTKSIQRCQIRTEQKLHERTMQSDLKAVKTRWQAWKGRSTKIFSQLSSIGSKTKQLPHSFTTKRIKPAKSEKEKVDEQNSASKSSENELPVTQQETDVPSVKTELRVTKLKNIDMINKASLPCKESRPFIFRSSSCPLLHGMFTSDGQALEYFKHPCFRLSRREYFHSPGYNESAENNASELCKIYTSKSPFRRFNSLPDLTQLSCDCPGCEDNTYGACTEVHRSRCYRYSDPIYSTSCFNINRTITRSISADLLYSKCNSEECVIQENDSGANSLCDDVNNLIKEKDSSGEPPKQSGSTRMLTITDDDYDKFFNEVMESGNIPPYLRRTYLDENLNKICIGVTCDDLHWAEENLKHFASKLFSDGFMLVHKVGDVTLAGLQNQAVNSVINVENSIFVSKPGHKLPNIQSGKCITTFQPSMVKEVSEHGKFIIADNPREDKPPMFATLGAVMQDMSNDILYGITAQHLYGKEYGFTEGNTYTTCDIHKQKDVGETVERICLSDKHKGYFGPHSKINRSAIDVAFFPIRNDISNNEIFPHFETNDGGSTKLTLFRGDAKEMKDKPFQQIGATSGKVTGEIIIVKCDFFFNRALVGKDCFIIASDNSSFIAMGDSGSLVTSDPSKCDSRNAYGVFISIESNFKMPGTKKCYEKVGWCVRLCNAIDMYERETGLELQFIPESHKFPGKCNINKEKRNVSANEGKSRMESDTPLEGLNHVKEQNINEKKMKNPGKADSTIKGCQLREKNGRHPKKVSRVSKEAPADIGRIEDNSIPKYSVRQRPISYPLNFINKDAPAALTENQKDRLKTIVF